MVPLHGDVGDIALQNGCTVVGVLCQSPVSISHTVAFEISFSTQIYSVFVTQVIPSGIIGVVACAYCVDVQLLDGQYVRFHPFGTQYISAVRIHFVPVGTFDQNGLAIEQQLTVMYFDMAEPHPLPYALYGAPAVGYGHSQGVEIWFLGTPRLDIHYRLFHKDQVTTYLSLAAPYIATVWCRQVHHDVLALAPRGV